MKGFLRKLELPEFVKDTRLTASLIIVLVLSLLGAIIGTLISPLFGLAMVLLFILTIIFVIYGIYVLAGNTNNYAANLSYRIKRGEQEAMIKMPLGIMLYDKDRQIQWINPYLQMYLHGKDIIGSSISSVDKELAKYLSDYFTDSFRIQIIEKKVNDLTLIADELNNFIPDLSEDNEIIITESQPVIGKKIISSPIRISSVEGVKQGIVFCGKVKLLTKREYKEKQGCFFTFVLDDYSASINVKYFPKTENSENAFDKMIKENSQVKCFGNIVMDKFTNKPAYMISNIELCVIDENSLKQIKKFAVEKKNYQYVLPKEYVEYTQQNLFVQ